MKPKTKSRYQGEEKQDVFLNVFRAGACSCLAFILLLAGACAAGGTGCPGNKEYRFTHNGVDVTHSQFVPIRENAIWTWDGETWVREEMPDELYRTIRAVQLGVMALWT